MSASAEVRVAVALGFQADPEVVQTSLFTEPSISVVSVTEIPWEVSDVHHDVLLVAGGVTDDKATLEYISKAREERADRPIIVLHPGTVDGFGTDALISGADDVITGPVTFGAIPDGRVGREFLHAVEKAVARRRRSEGAAGGGRGEVIVTVGPKGGTGKTLVTCNLAAALSAKGRKVIIIDLDLQFGDVGLSLGLSPDRTIYELAIAPGGLDGDKVSDFLTPYSNTLSALLAPRQPDHAGVVTVAFLRELFPVLRSMCDYVVVDTPPGFTPEVITAIDCSTQACMVAMLDAPSLKNTKLGLETLALMEYDPAHIRVVLNRADSRVGVTTEDVTELLGRTPDVMVPSHRSITRSVNEGTPVALSHTHNDARAAFESLADLYAGVSIPQSKQAAAEAAAETPTRRRTLFGRSAAKAN